MIRKCTVPEIWCAMDRLTDRWTDRRTDRERLKKWHTEVDVPPNNQYEELLEKNNTHTVMGNRTYRWKQPSLDHLQTPKQNQKEYLSKIGYKVGGGGGHTLMFF